MNNAVKRIGVLTSGGDAPGMNACIRAVVRSSLARGIECVGIRRGYAGLIAGDFMEMDNSSVSRIINRGGTILYSARCDEFRTREGQQKAANTCKLLGLDGLVAIGGDGTFRGAQDLSKFGISVVGIPGTIDNDIVCTMPMEIVAEEEQDLQSYPEESFHTLCTCLLYTSKQGQSISFEEYLNRVGKKNLSYLAEKMCIRDSNRTASIGSNMVCECTCCLSKLACCERDSQL